MRTLLSYPLVLTLALVGLAVGCQSSLSEGGLPFNLYCTSTTEDGLSVLDVRLTGRHLSEHYVLDYSCDSAPDLLLATSDGESLPSGSTVALTGGQVRWRVLQSGTGRHSLSLRLTSTGKNPTSASTTAVINVESPLELSIVADGYDLFLKAVRSRTLPQKNYTLEYLLDGKVATTPVVSGPLTEDSPFLLLPLGVVLPGEHSVSIRLHGWDGGGTIDWSWNEHVRFSPMTVTIVNSGNCLKARFDRNPYKAHCDIGVYMNIPAFCSGYPATTAGPYVPPQKETRQTSITTAGSVNGVWQDTDAIIVDYNEQCRDLMRKSETFYNWTMGGSGWVTTGSYQTNYQMDFSQAYISLTLKVTCVPGLEVKVVNSTDATFTPQVTYSAQ